MGTQLSDYAARLAQAMGIPEGQVPTPDAKKALASHLGITLQAVEKVFKVGEGATKALSAANNSKAARRYAVNPDWLATGDGSRELVHPRPEELAILEDIRLLEHFDPNLLRNLLATLHEQADAHRKASAVLPTKHRGRHSAKGIKPAPISSEASHPDAAFGGTLSDFGALADGPVAKGRRK